MKSGDPAVCWTSSARRESIHRSSFACLVLLLRLVGCSGKKEPDSKGGDNTSPISLTTAEFEAGYNKEKGEGPGRES